MFDEGPHVQWLWSRCPSGGGASLESKTRGGRVKCPNNNNNNSSHGFSQRTYEGTESPFTLLCAALLLVRGNETGSEWVLALWMKTWTNVYKCAR